MGKVATSPLPSRGTPPLQSGGGNQKWPTCGQSGYVTSAGSGMPTAAERGAKSEVTHLWAKWLRHPCRLGDPHRFKAGGKSEVAHLWEKWLRHPFHLGDPHRFKAGGEIRSGPLVGNVSTSPLPSRGSPPLQSGWENQKWPTCGQSGCVTSAVSGIPTASERGGGNQKWPTCGQSGYVTPAGSGIPTASQRVGKSEVAHLWAKWLRHPCRLGDPHRFTTGGGKSQVAHLWAKWLRHPCRLGDPHRIRASGKIRSGPLVGKVATSPLPSRGSPPLQSGWENQKWPTCGQSGYVTPGVSGIPTASERGGESEVAHLWAKWLRHPWRLGDPHRFRAGGGNQKWPTCGQSGYVTPDVSGIPTASERVGKSEVAHLWATWLRHPCRPGDPHRFRAGGKIRRGPLVGKLATSPLLARGCPPLQSGWEIQKWPTCGQSGYVTPAVSGIPTASQRVGKSEVAHLWAKWLRHPCRLGDPHRFTASGKIRSGPLVGKVATSPLPSRGSPPLHSKWENQKWPTCGQTGCVTPAVSGIPTASQRVGKSEVAHLWAKWLRHPCRLGDPHRFRAGGGGGIRSGPLVGKVITSPLPARGCPPLQSGGQNQKWPTCGQSG